MAKFTKRGVPLTRNDETMTESQFFNMFRQAFRKLTMQWKGGTAYLKEVRRENQSDNKRLKFEYPCERCKKWFKRDEIELDHIKPCGGISSFEDLGIWASRAFIEKDGGWQSLCVSCHQIKTNEDRGLSDEEPDT